MHNLTPYPIRVGRLTGTLDQRATVILGRLTARARQGILSSCRPVIRSLGTSDWPWAAVFWMVVAALMAMLLVITFILFEGSMWT
jgi:hypothetical protein